MIIILNGPLGVGKSTLAEALMESIDGCVMLDGDHLAAANPPPADSREHLHATIALMVAHHQRFGYRHFVVNHYWDSADALDDLRRCLCSIGIPDEVRCFLLTLPLEENLRRIERRQGARALDEREFEARTSSEERDALARATGDELGERFDVSASPDVLVTAMLRLTGLDG